MVICQYEAIGANNKTAAHTKWRRILGEWRMALGQRCRPFLGMQAQTHNRREHALCQSNQGLIELLQGWQSGCSRLCFGPELCYDPARRNQSQTEEAEENKGTCQMPQVAVSHGNTSQYGTGNTYES
jgi:hypothetical protein